MEELVTVGSHDHRAIEVDGLTGRRYRARDGGLYDMLPADAAALVREGGFKTGLGPGAAAPGGYVCPKGHRNYLPTCGRCRSAEDREVFRRAGFTELADDGLARPMIYSFLRDDDDEGWNYGE